jgi:hypothetical protein
LSACLERNQCGRAVITKPQETRSRKASAAPVRGVPVNPRVELIVVVKHEPLLVLGWWLQDLHNFVELLIGDVASGA